MPHTAEGFPPQVGDRFTLLRELGRGGMATVFLAEDRKHNRQVAIKILHRELMEVLGPARFQREVAIAARLNHPHILTLIESGESGGMLWYAMPFVEGESLRARMERVGQFTVADVLGIPADRGGARLRP